MPRIRPEEAPHPPSPGSLHDDHVIALLRSGAHAALLSAYFGEAEYRELCLLARLAATRRPKRAPLVCILPGIMGSKLGTARNSALDLLWLHPTAVAEGGLAQLALPGKRSLRAVGVMLPGYLKMKLTLEVAGFHAVFHAFDWRRDLMDLGRRFLESIERSAAAEVMVVGHSMGGLVARAALALDSRHRIARLIQLAAPNEGSFASVQALRAVYATVRKLAALDTRHTAEELARGVFRTLHGLYQLLPSGTACPHDLFDIDAWPDDDFAPDAALLAKARRTRAKLPAPDERCSAIAGIGQETITAMALRGAELEYASTLSGDGTVALPCAEWRGAPTWYARGTHGELTNDDVVLAAIVELLTTGDTARLSGKRPPPDDTVVRRVTDGELRRQAVRKVSWDSLSLESRRRILDPVITPEFLA